MRWKGLVLATLGAMLAATVAGAADQLPAFKLMGADGKELTQEQVQGSDKKTVFVMVQTACSQCSKELEEMDVLWDDLKAKANVYVVMLDMNSAPGMERYKNKGHKAPVLLDDKFKFPASVGIEVTPATMIVGPDLKIVYKKTGYRPGDLEALMEML